MGSLQKGTPLRLDALDPRWECARIEVEASNHFDSGASGKIFLATMGQDRDRMRVALKVFPTELSDIRRELLRRELRASRSFTHRYILPFLGTAVHDQQTVIVLPYMQNGNLLQYLERQSKLGSEWLGDCGRLIGQVAEALHYLHDTARFVHGDLKCQNVLVSDEGEALLADFGLATTIAREADQATTSTSIKTMATLRFCAPELFLPEEHRLRHRSKTQATDVYAFGMLVLQAFTQALPWYGSNDIRVVLQLAKQQIPPRPLHVPALNDFLWFVCSRCWRIDPAERPSARLVSRALALNARLAGSKGDGLKNIPHDILEPMFTLDWRDWGFPTEFEAVLSGGAVEPTGMALRHQLARSIRNAEHARTSRSIISPDDIPTTPPRSSAASGSRQPPDAPRRASKRKRAGLESLDSHSNVTTPSMLREDAVFELSTRDLTPSPIPTTPPRKPATSLRQPPDTPTRSRVFKRKRAGSDVTISMLREDAVFELSTPTRISITALPREQKRSSSSSSRHLDFTLDETTPIQPCLEEEEEYIIGATFQFIPKR
ncbi:kinase-like protein [Exidia glandulosa HHB12029]|uniref:Kinase-like protein n=1 Tax=Exidia glandulosa HHB12029 TaxID=1314781 RepID=A0A165G684_EXIGL|nr:kinase-like protein [Exidia glandulosa HHB12029]